MKKWLRDNGLSISLAALFFIFWGAQAVAGFKLYNQEAWTRNLPVLNFESYLMSGHFWQATGENWESEFLQMGAYVVMTSFLYQRGSAESKDPDKKDPPPDQDPGREFGWLYRNSLGLTFLVLFAGAFAIHANGGWHVFNSELRARGKVELSFGEYLTEPEFWFQSFQNWQSEFLAVLAIVVLSIFLRQHGSPESKAVEDPDSKTGN